MVFMLTKLPMLVLVYQPTLFASTLTSLRNLIISFWYAPLAFARGAEAAMFAADSCWWLSVAGTSMVGKGKQDVISRRPGCFRDSMPTRAPVDTVGKVLAAWLTSFITTCERLEGLVGWAASHKGDLPGLPPAPP